MSFAEYVANSNHQLRGIGIVSITGDEPQIKVIPCGKVTEILMRLNCNGKPFEIRYSVLPKTTILLTQSGKPSCFSYRPDLRTIPKK